MNLKSIIQGFHSLSNEYFLMTTEQMVDCLIWAFSKILSPNDEHIKRIVKNIYKVYGMNLVEPLTRTESGQLNSLVVNIISELRRSSQMREVGVLPRRRIRKYRKRKKTSRKKRSRK